MNRYIACALTTCGLLAACTPLDASNQPRDGSLDQVNLANEGGVSSDGGPVILADGAIANGSPAPGTVETGLGTPCTGEGTMRCSAAGAGARQSCRNGAWATSESCASGQICQEQGGTAPTCQTVAEVCRGSAGLAVCDGQGNLIVCSASGTVESQQTCGSARLCQLGVVTKRCALCVPETEFKCTGTQLQVCAPDGQSFVMRETCATEALCNKLVGMCTASTCAANKVACAGNTLTTCNADGSGFAQQMPCPAGSTCDTMGADCNLCEPGMKKCENGMVMSCDPTGQMFVASACPGSQRCVGAGQCAACATNEDCSSMTQGCTVGVCGTNNMCSAQNAAAGTSCTAASNKPGTCSNGSCVCTPQCSGKQCGDDGCGGQCPNQCSFVQACAMNRCVDCTSNADCSGSLDGCRTGMCTNGVCSQVNAAPTKACSTLSGSGTCLNGSCNVCRTSCATNFCGSDGCGGTCRCGSDRECSNEQCVLRLGSACATPQTNSSECGSTVSDSRTCFRMASRPSFCVKATTPCPSGTELFGGGALGACLYRCTPGGIFGCPSPLSTCTEVYPGQVDTPAYCTR